MATVRFRWDALLVNLRRESCPCARWDAATRSWIMSAHEAALFLSAAHDRLHFAKCSCELAIDGERWLVGFVRGAPMRVGEVRDGPLRRTRGGSTLTDLAARAAPHVAFVPPSFHLQCEHPDQTACGCGLARPIARPSAGRFSAYQWIYPDVVVATGLPSCTPSSCVTRNAAMSKASEQAIDRASGGALQAAGTRAGSAIPVRSRLPQARGGRPNALICPARGQRRGYSSASPGGASTNQRRR